MLDTEADLTIAAAERARAQAILASYMSGVQDPSQVVATAGSPSVAEVPAVETLLAQAESTRGELRAYRQDADAARFALRAASSAKMSFGSVMPNRPMPPTRSTLRRERRREAWKFGQDMGDSILQKQRGIQRGLSS